MKALTVFCLIAMISYGFSAGADSTNEISTKIVETARDSGRIRLRILTTFRGKQRSIVEIQKITLAATNVTRSFYAGSHLAMIESDDDADGVFESFCLFREGSRDFEMFNRNPNGTVSPVSGRILEATKRKLKAADEAVDKLFSGQGVDDKELESILNEARKKISEAEEEMPSRK